MRTVLAVVGIFSLAIGVAQVAGFYPPPSPLVAGLVNAIEGLIFIGLVVFWRRFE